MQSIILKKTFCLWFTGLSGAGKTTIGRELKNLLEKGGLKISHLDGDELRKTLCADLGFSKQDREENNRRVIFLSKTLAEKNIIPIVTFISPFDKIRAMAREYIPGFIEVFVNCPLEECIKRDVKGLYKKALMGEIKEFTGIDSPYEKPIYPEIEILSHLESIERACGKIINYLIKKGYVKNS